MLTTALQVFALSSKDREAIAIFDDNFKKIAIQMNEQLGGTKLDEFTRLKFVFYSSEEKTFLFRHSINGIASLSKVQKNALYQQTLNRICSTNILVPLTDTLGFRIRHVYESETTGLRLFEADFQYRDCLRTLGSQGAVKK